MEERNSNYAEMEDSSGKLINAWLTPIKIRSNKKHIHKTVRKGDR